MLASQPLLPAPSAAHPPAGCHIRVDDAQKQEGMKRKTKNFNSQLVMSLCEGWGSVLDSDSCRTKPWAQTAKILRQQHKLIACEFVFELEHEWGAGR